MFPCCIPLKNMIENAGIEGISVIAHREGARRRFCLQARPYRADQLDRVASADDNARAVLRELGLEPLHVAMNAPIGFCPKCGTDLAELIERHVMEFDDLANRHLKFMAK